MQHKTWSAHGTPENGPFSEAEDILCLLKLKHICILIGSGCFNERLDVILRILTKVTELLCGKSISCVLKHFHEYYLTLLMEVEIFN